MLTPLKPNKEQLVPFIPLGEKGFTMGSDLRGDRFATRCKSLGLTWSIVDLGRPATCHAAGPRPSEGSSSQWASASTLTFRKKGLPVRSMDYKLIRYNLHEEEIDCVLSACVYKLGRRVLGGWGVGGLANS